MKIVFYSAISAALLSCSVGATAIDFSQAWYQVAQHNDALEAKKEQVNNAEAMQEAAKSLYLPEVNITGSFTHFDKPVGVETPTIATPIPGVSIPSFDIPLTHQNFAHSSLNAVLPIYTGGRITAAQDIRAAQVDEAQSNFNLAKRNTFTQLVQYYFGVVLSEQVYRARLDAVEVLTDHLRHAEKLEQQGQIAKVERLLAQVSVDRARIDAQKALRDDEIAKFALTTMLKQQEPVLPSTPLFINNSAAGVAPYLQKTLASHPAMAILSAKREQAQGMVNVASAKHLPEVMLYGNYNLYSDDSATGELLPEWMVGVGVKIPIIERSGTGSEIVAAQSSVRQVALMRTQMEQDLSILVEKTYAEMTQALEEYNSLASSQVLSAETVVLRQKAFSQGLSTSLEVVDAQLYATSIRVQRLSASYNYVKSLAQLLAVSGEVASFMDYLHINGIEVK